MINEYPARLLQPDVLTKTDITYETVWQLTLMLMENTYMKVMKKVKDKEYDRIVISMYKQEVNRSCTY